MLNAKFAIGAAIAGAFVLGTLVVGFSSAQPEENISKAPAERASSSFSELEQEEIGELVRAYLMENPEVIIEAVNAYSAQQRLAAEQQMQMAAAKKTPA